jgi:hypothetical protein
VRTNEKKSHERIGVRFLVIASRFLAYPNIFLDPELRTKYRTHALFFFVRAIGYCLALVILYSGWRGSSFPLAAMAASSLLSLLYLRKIKRVNFALSLLIVLLDILVCVFMV